MRAASIFLFPVLAILAAQAQPQPETGFVITAADCRRLVTKHTPAPDVAYRAGIDVHGRPVAPAESGAAARIVLPDEIVIDVLIPLDEFLGDKTPPRTARAEVRVGAVTVVGDRLSFNGQPLGDSAAAAIAAECRRILKHSR